MSNPSTPEHHPIPSLIGKARRVHTLPSRLQFDPTRTPPQISHSPDDIETLFYTGFAKVVTFQSSGSSSRPTSRSGAFNAAGQEDALPSWMSSSDRTLAAGPLTIYRVSNTGVSFLSSGSSFLKHILPRSQCWCVDDDCTFVLKGRDDSYYRLELPGNTSEQRDNIEQFKKTLDQVLRYEKTPCPFKQGYVDVHDNPPTPARTKSLLRHSPAKKWRQQLSKRWEPEDPEARAEYVARQRARTDSIESVPRPITPSPLRKSTMTKPSNPLPSREIYSTLETELQEAHHELQDSDLTEQSSENGSNPSDNEKQPADFKDSPVAEMPLHPLKQHPIQHLSATRSVTAPPQLSVAISPPSSSASVEIIVDDVETASLSSRDSFYSLADEDLESLEQEPGHLRTTFISTHSRNSSGTTSSYPETPRANVYSLPSPIIASDSSSTSDHSMLESSCSNSPPTILRLRRSPATTKDELAKPPLPEFSIFDERVKPLGAELIRKTYSILMAPPSHLISLMLHIAGLLLNRIPPRVARHIPGAWENSDADNESDEDAWNDLSDEDDFGFPLKNPGRKMSETTYVSAISSPNHQGVSSEDGWGID